MLKYPGSPKKRKTSARKNKAGSRLPGKAAGSRRKFLKMAGAVSAALLLQNHAKGMVAPKFPSKWLSAIQLDDVNLDDYYTGCLCTVTSGNDTGITIPIQQQSCWCAIAVSLGMTQFYNGPHNTWQCTLLDNYLFSTGLTTHCCGYPDYSPSPQLLPAICSTGWYADYILIWLTLFAYGLNQIPSWESIVSNIDHGRPMVIQVDGTDPDTGTHHVAVISGYDCGSFGYNDAFLATVNICDPFYGFCPSVYYCYVGDFYQSMSGDYTVQWTRVFGTKPPS